MAPEVANRGAGRLTREEAVAYIFIYSSFYWTYYKLFYMYNTSYCIYAVVIFLFLKDDDDVEWDH